MTEKRIEVIETRLNQHSEQINLTREFNAVTAEKIKCLPEIKKDLKGVKGHTGKLNIQTALHTQSLKVITRLLWAVNGLMVTIISGVVIAYLTQR